MEIEKRNAIDFLLFSYFRITLGNGDDVDKILNSIIEKAYIDATAQGAFITKLYPQNATEQQKEDIRESIQQPKGCAISEINKFLDSLPSANEFDKKHDELCNRLLEVYKNIENAKTQKPAFTYGNAQKWINMSIKYLYLLSSIFPAESEFNKKYADDIRDLKHKFHLPVDRYILYMASHKSHKNEKLEHGLTIDDIPSASWSNWGKVEYDEFKRKIDKRFKPDEKKDSPIDWEFSAWIEAKKKGVVK